ncbi:hypothetical protein E2C01_008690 [Portunus trituberculatus]|uniref:Uncharacterized protein n=1 Tax=Portunus trituberculatus TaxID=210409 RepID=A0A5B7D502_PORTR|nr:hypothetical protein [Portunus trituberculatus]
MAEGDQKGKTEQTPPPLWSPGGKKGTPVSPSSSPQLPQCASSQTTCEISVLHLIHLLNTLLYHNSQTYLSRMAADLPSYT